MISEIRIEQLELRARLGVTEAERAQPQRLLCLAKIVPAAGENLRDQIEETVDYAAVAVLLRQISGAKVYRLLETMAEDMAEQIVTKFPVRRVTLELRKFALRDAEFVGVTSVKETAK